MKNRKFILTALIACILLAACADLNSTPVNTGGIFCTENLAEGEVLTVYAHGDEIIFDSIDEMLNFAAMSGAWRVEIVRVEVLSERVAWHNTTLAFQHEDADSEGDYPDCYEPRTFHQVRVLEVFQGDVQVGDILEVMQRGGQIDNVRLECSSFLPLAPGDDLVLFLSSLVWMENSPAGIASPRQAVYRFPALEDGDRTVSFDEELEFFPQLSENIAEYALPLTFGELADFQFQNFGRLSDAFQAMLEETLSRE